MASSAPLLALLVAAAGQAHAQTADAGVCRTVLGLGKGTEFGEVDTGESYAFEAHGLIGFNMGCDGPCSSAEPDGNTFERSDPKARGVRLGPLICPRQRIYSLVGKVDGRCVRLGKEGKLKAPASGMLTLYFNDDAFSESSGGWEVCVHGTSPPAPGPYAVVRHDEPPARPAPRPAVAKAPEAKPMPYFSRPPAPAQEERPAPPAAVEAPPAPPVEQAPEKPRPPLAVPKEVDDLLAEPPGLPARAAPGGAAPAGRSPAVPALAGAIGAAGEKPPEPPARTAPAPRPPPRGMKGEAETFAPLPASGARAAAEEAPERPLEKAEAPLSFDAVPRLIEYLRKGSRSLRYRAADELARRGPAAAEAVGALIGALRDKEAAVRSSAAMALGNMGPAGLRGTKELRRLTRDNSIDVRHSAEFALERLDAGQ